MEKLENYENQSWRQNVIIIGLKEGTEGKNPPVFFEKWIPEILDMDMQRERLKTEANSKSQLLPFTAKDSYKDTDGRIVLVKGESVLYQ